MFLDYHKKRFIRVKNKGNIKGGKNPSTGCKNHQKIERIYFLQNVERIGSNKENHLGFKSVTCRIPNILG